MAPTNLPDKYATLDGLRGVAAALVVMFHFPALFHLGAIPDGYLAVDLFFAMSGFVIASAYEHKLLNGTLGSRNFLIIRLVRLYPLYLAGVLLGVAALLFRLPVSDWHLVGSAFPPGVLMLPSHVAIRLFYPFAFALPWFYPLNPSSWSLFFELAGNVAYGAFAKRLTTRMLPGIIAVSSLILVVTILREGTLNFGALWPTAYIGFARIGYSFTMGVLLFRLRRKARWKSDWAAIGLIFVAMTMFCFPVPACVRPAFTLFIVLFAIPAVVWTAGFVEPSSRLRSIFVFSGTVSYGIYVFHVPVAFIIQELLLRIDFVPHKTTVAGALLMPVVIALAWLSETRYDAPVRRWLIRTWRDSKYGRPPGIANVDPTANQ